MDKILEKCSFVYWVQEQIYVDISVYGQQKLRKYFCQRKCKIGVLILNLTNELNHLKMG